jgi:hypothetical protein
MRPFGVTGRPAGPNPVAAEGVEETLTAHNPVVSRSQPNRMKIVVPSLYDNPGASTNPTQSHPVAVEGGGEQTTTTHPTAPNPVATGGRRKFTRYG